MQICMESGQSRATNTPLVMKLRTTIDRATLLSMRAVLKGTKIYLDDDLTLLQQEHKQEEMKKVMAAREAGKWAIYHDRRVTIRERIDKEE